MPIDERASDFLAQCARVLKGFDPHNDEHNAVAQQIHRRLLKPVCGVLLWADTPEGWPAMSKRFPRPLRKRDPVTGRDLIDRDEVKSLANKILGGFLVDKLLRGKTLTVYGALDAAMGTTNWDDNCCLAYLVGRRRIYDSTKYPSVWQWVSRRLSQRTQHQLCQSRHEAKIVVTGDLGNASSRNAQQPSSLSIDEREFVKELARSVACVIEGWGAILRAVFECLLSKNFVKRASLDQWVEGKKNVEDCFNVSGIAMHSGLPRGAVKEAIQELVGPGGKLKSDSAFEPVSKLSQPEFTEFLRCLRELLSR